MNIEKYQIFLILLHVFSSIFLSGQRLSADGGFFQVSPRVGYAFPNYDSNNTPYIDYVGGLNLGISADYYFSWIGLGLDVDYINTRTNSEFVTNNIFTAAPTAPITAFNLTEESITTLFYGIGPSFQWRNQSKVITVELNTRVGFASLKGGRVLLEGENINTGSFERLNFHAGYDDSQIFSFKGQLKGTYNFSEALGVNIGGFYMRHLGAEEDSEAGISSAFYSLVENAGTLQLADEGITFRDEPCKCDVSFISVFAGLTYRFKLRDKYKCYASK